MPKTIVSHPERCLGCLSCVIECSMAHALVHTSAEALSQDVPPQPRLHIEPVGDLGVPMQCRHCEDPLCLVVCPNQAIHRSEDGETVLLDTELCVGCRLCLLVCPYGVIDTVRMGTAAVKCDHCLERTASGQEPACVAGCPTGALTFEDVSDLQRDLSLQGLGEALPDAVPHTMKLSCDEYLAQSFNHKIPAFLQHAVSAFIIDSELCKACGKCLKTCPIDGITGQKKVPHVIDQEMCLRCGQCRENCPFDAVDTALDAEIELVLCDQCGRPYTTLRDFEAAQSKVADQVTIDAVCPLCRRSQTARRLAEASQKKLRPTGCATSGD